MAFTFTRRYAGPVQAVIFDMAGTIMDFGSRAPAGVFVEVFARNGVEVTIAEARGPMGAEKRTHIAELMALPTVRARWTERYGNPPGEEDIDRLYAEFIPMQVACLSRYAELVPGMIDTADELRRRRVQIAANSGYNREMLDVCLGMAERQGLKFASAVAASDVPRARPLPAMCLTNAVQLAVDAVAACVKVDDTIPGIEEGLAAGMWTVGVTVSGNEVGLSLEEWKALDPVAQAKARARATDRLARAGAHMVVDSVADLLPCIAEFDRRLALGKRP